MGELTVDDVQVGTADGACLDPDQELPRPGRGSGTSAATSGRFASINNCTRILLSLLQAGSGR
jgi:hypothetical protein